MKNLMIFSLFMLSTTASNNSFLNQCMKNHIQKKQNEAQRLSDMHNQALTRLEVEKRECERKKQEESNKKIAQNVAKIAQAEQQSKTLSILLRNGRR